MKKILFLFAIPALILTGCNDNDDNDDQSSSSSSTSAGRLSSTINNENFSTDDNISRYLSYDATLLIRSQLEERTLTIELESFIGNGTYSVAQNSPVTVKYSDNLNGLTVNYVGSSGEITISNFDEDEQTYSANFNIQLISEENNSVSTFAEGEDSLLNIFSKTDPSA